MTHPTPAPASPASPVSPASSASQGSAPGASLPPARLLTDRTLAAVERLLHLEAASGLSLLAAAAIALLWANSSLAPSYHALWHLPLGFSLGNLRFSQPLHFWVNDGLMTLFFLAVGMEIRREIHGGALKDIRQASLPILAALGGVAVPALIFLAVVALMPASAVAMEAATRGWAVPTATDIAFAVGVLALLGPGVPAEVRIFLLAVAIIDDIIAILIIALFYAGGLDLQGLSVAGLGMAMVILFQRMGLGSAWVYVLPALVTWIGLLMTGAHPTLAGVVLGMMTPVLVRPRREPARTTIDRLSGQLLGRGSGQSLAPLDDRQTHAMLSELSRAQRDLLPPVERVRMALHPWVAFGILPLFALANAGVSLEGLDLSAAGPQWVMGAVALALVLGKPVGVVGISWLMVKLGWCRLSPEIGWGGLWLIGLLAGIGFTMSIFIATLAFQAPELLGAAKLGVLAGSAIAATLGLCWGLAWRQWRRGLALSSGA